MQLGKDQKMEQGQHYSAHPTSSVLNTCTLHNEAAMFAGPEYTRFLIFTSLANVNIAASTHTKFAFHPKHKSATLQVI